MFAVSLSRDEYDRRAFQTVGPRMVEFPSQMVVRALLGNRRKSFPGTPASEDGDVVSDPQEGEKERTKRGQEYRKKRHGHILDACLRDHLSPPVEEKDPCQNGDR